MRFNMDFNKIDLNNAVIIADASYMILLSKWKNEIFPFNPIILSKDDVSDMLTFRYKDNTSKDKCIQTIMIKEKVDYSTACKYLSFLPYADLNADIEQSKFLSKIFDYIKEYLETEILTTSFDNRDIFLFEDNEDYRLKRLIKRKLNKEAKDISIIDLNFDFEKYNYKDNDILQPIYFDTKFEQYFYIFANIRKKLLKDKSMVSKIRIHTEEKQDEFYIKLFEDIFKIDVNYKIERSLFSLQGCKDTLQLLQDNHKVDSSILDANSILPGVKKIIELIDTYKLNQLDFDIAYNSLIEMLSSKTYSEGESKNGVIINSSLMLSNDEIYITDFKNGVFYKEYKDDQIYSDIILQKLSLNTSYQNMELDRRLKSNFLKYSNISLLSRIKFHQSDSIFDSQFISEYDNSEVIQEEKRKEYLNNKKKDKTLLPYFERVKEIHLHQNNTDKTCNLNYDDLSLTSDALKLLSINKMDKNFVHKAVNDFNSYDFNYDKGNLCKYFVENKMNKTYSITDLEKYNRCPFKYLLDKLKIESDDSTPYSKRGTFIHAVLEQLNAKDEKGNYKDVNTIIEAGKTKFVAEGNSLDDLTFLPLFEYHLKYILNNLILEYRKMNVVSSYPEYKFTYNIDDNIKIFGIIDNILITQSRDGDEKYFTVVDYKTGKETLSKELCFLGITTQLPIYTKALLSHAKEKDSPFYNCTFGGIGLQHVYFASFNNSMYGKDKYKKNSSFYKDERMEDLVKSMRFSGMFLSDDNYMKSLDEECDIPIIESIDNIKPKQRATGLVEEYNIVKESEKNPESVIMRISKNKKPYYYCQDINSFFNDCVNAIKDSVKSIKENKFDILPNNSSLDKDAKLPCEFCSYKDICYYHKSQDNIATNRDRVLAHFDFRNCKGKESD